MERKLVNELNELKLNAELRKRGIPEEYHFGICERDETEYSKIHGITTFTYWNLALYKTDGLFSTRVQQIEGVALINKKAYDTTEFIIEMTIQQIQMGMFDRYKPFSIFEDNLASTECMNTLYKILYGKEEF